MKKIFYIFIITGISLLSTSCVGDLDQLPHKETTSGNIYTTAANYKSVLAKLYASYVIAGQEQGGGNPDLSSNSGYDYMRCYFNMQECGTEEIASTWLEGDNVKGLTYLSWDVNDPWVSDTYYRIYYTIALCNEFLRNAGDSQIAGFSESEQTDIRHYRAEARFLRALSYYHAMDLYRNIPFVTEANPVGSYIPPRYTSAQIFDFIETELTTIENELLPVNECEYARASQAAAQALLARLYLNAEVYSGTARYTDCITYCRRVMQNGYHLEPEYAKLFNADNNLRTHEIIFSFAVDANRTTSWGATTYIICGAVSSTSEFQNPADYGVTSGWGSFRVRQELPLLFPEGDKRGMFFTEGQSISVDIIDDQSKGYFAEKWTNLTDAGEAASNTGALGVSTDFPVFRLADVYLMFAEAVLRGGAGGSAGEAVGYINLLRERAYGNTSGNIGTGDLTLNFILDERARELYWECVRRTDLIRYGRFTDNSYLWQWKGGVKDGKGVNDKYNTYPIPASELSANPNLYNEKY